MSRAFDPEKVARYVLAEHERRADYRNLPAEIAPLNVGEAYAAQLALVRLLVPRKGKVAGLKIATTTKIMQQLMGIDHPCGGTIFAQTVHQSPAELRLADHQHVVIECELALRLARDLPAAGAPYTAQSVQPAVGAAMPAFELIEDRNADYKQTSALSIIADNCWNAGIVLGAPIAYDPARPLAGLPGRLTVNESRIHEGRTEDALDTLAWIANLAAGQDRPLAAGMVVITGSVIPTLPIAPGDRFVFSLDGLGSAEVTAV
ncbi:MAG TPA: fumarylacetoacetate hydrolase family protein [Xanthobacteraceae bacterium]|nr:fumarylacetoacetate hydrolase family protein [Xanthobacteraceae bacterium]